MKSFLFSLFLLVGSTLAVYAQEGIVTEYPKVEASTRPAAKITKVELTPRYTIITISFRNPRTSDRYLEKYRQREMIKRLREKGFDLPMPDEETFYVSWSPEAKLIMGKKKFSFIKATGIPLEPEQRTMTEGERVTFKVYFDRVEPGIEVFDLYEGKDHDSMEYWNFYGVHINNPKNPNEKQPEAITTVPTKVVSMLALRGTVFDARTRKPINATLACKPGFRKDIDSLRTSSSHVGVFRASLKAGQRYEIVALATGYQPRTEVIDLGTESPTGEKAIYLEPIVAEETAMKEKEVLRKEVAVGETIRLNNIYFETAESNLLPESFEELDKLVALLQEKPTLRIRLEGHTDGVGDFDANLQLSRERANAVKEYLVNKGIAPTRIETKGYGSTRPVTRGDSDEIRQKNRRVEFVVLGV